MSARLTLSPTEAAMLAAAVRDYGDHRADVAAVLLSPEPGEDPDGRDFEVEQARFERLAIDELSISDACVQLADRVEGGGEIELTRGECRRIVEANGHVYNDEPPVELAAIMQRINDAARIAPLTDRDTAPTGPEGAPADRAHRDAAAVPLDQSPAGRDRAGDLGASSASGGRRHQIAESRPTWRIDDVLARTDLAALLDEVAVPGTHAMRGRRWHCPVPEHDDQHPSVTVHVDHRGHERWHCWSGDDSHRGDAIDLVMVTQRRSQADAIEWLANRAGMVADQPLPPVRRKPAPARPRQVPLSPRVGAYVDACERMLWNTQPGHEVRRWLHDRGFSDAVLRANRVGADPGAERWMPRRRGLPHGESLAATFPALGRDGELRYVQARYLQPGEHGDKYDNPAGSLGTNPRLAWTRTADGPARSGLLVICEGVPDALTAADAGLPAVAILGNQAPDRRIAGALVDYRHQHDATLIAVRDHDEGGRVHIERLTALLEELNTGLTVIEPPEPGMDLNAWALRDPGWLEAVFAEVPMQGWPVRHVPQPARPDGFGIV